tara:strand:- start:624 stop:977 length:354 start_codon:yes stop_codon:yes gene_type:complete
MTETYCDSGAVKLKAGVDATTLHRDQYTQLINQAEALANSVMRIDLLSDYAGLDDSIKQILEDFCSSHAAVSAVAYDLRAFSSRAMAQTIMDANWAKYKEAERLLKEKETTDFIQNP